MTVAMIYATAWMIIHTHVYMGEAITAIPMPYMEFCQKSADQYNKSHINNHAECIAGDDK